jgi:uncharacterized protein (DUF433 family)
MNLPEFLSMDQYGEIFLRGHRIGLYHLLYYYNEGYSSEMLSAEYPSLSLELIEKSLAFYHANRTEVDAYLVHCETEIRKQRATAPPGPDIEQLRRRLEARRRAEAALEVSSRMHLDRRSSPS